MKLELVLSRCHGHITKPTPAQRYDPRLMLIHLGSKAVKSVPAEMELAAMFVPNCARVNAAAMTKTPKRVAPLTPGSSKNLVSRVSGDQIGSSLGKMTVAEDVTMIPMKEVTANPHGIERNWGRSASFGRRANRAKSGSLTIRVAKLAIADMMPETIAHASVLPDAVAPWWTMGPIPLARTIAQMKKATPAVGTT